MKNYLLAGVAALSLFAAGAAVAADLPARRGPVASPVYVPPAFTWTGFYAGVNAGYGFGKFNDGGRAFDDPKGFVGGGQIGYNYQFGQFVVGLETDIQYADLKGDGLAGLAPLSSTAKLDYFGTVRGRVGVAFDRLLPYVTGGFAYGNTKISYPAVGLSSSNTQYGYAVGAGLEYALTNNFTLRGEYLYVNLGKESFLAATAPSRVGTEFSVVRASANYKF